MSSIDFANSYMTWFGSLNGSMSRIQLDAACTLIDDEKGREDSYYLIAPCRSEHTHSDDQLLTMPNYDFRGIFGDREYTLIRTHWVGNPDYLDDPGFDNTGGRTLSEAGLIKDKWDDVRLDIRSHDGVKALRDDEERPRLTLPLLRDDDERPRLTLPLLRDDDERPRLTLPLLRDVERPLLRTVLREPLRDDPLRTALRVRSPRLAVTLLGLVLLPTERMALRVRFSSSSSPRPPRTRDRPALATPPRPTVEPRGR